MLNFEQYYALATLLSLNAVKRNLSVWRVVERLQIGDYRRVVLTIYRAHHLDGVVRPVELILRTHS